MFKIKFIAVVGAAFALLASASTAAAQSEGPQDRGAAYGNESDRASGNVQGDRVLPGRVGGGRQQNQGRRGATPTPEQNRAAAQALATGLNVNCQVTEATLMGARPEGGNVYEAACASGPGYILIGTTPPTASDCVDLAGGAAIARERDPAAEVGLQCTLPANQNGLAVITGYARQAGVNCQIDAAMATAIGRYEVGCANQDGFWIERQENTWASIPCWELKSQGELCRFTTDAEAASVWPTILAGTEASTCAVTQLREVGVERTGDRLTIYELKCAAGDGWIARMDASRAVKRLQACSDPTTYSVARGCQLSPQALPEGVTAQ